MASDGDPLVGGGAPRAGRRGGEDEGDGGGGQAAAREEKSVSGNGRPPERRGQATRATVTMRTSVAPAARSARAQARAVAPVV